MQLFRLSHHKKSTLISYKKQRVNKLKKQEKKGNTLATLQIGTFFS